MSALFGVGGGVVIVPLLLLVAAWSARTATATSLAAIGITALSGVITYAFHSDVSVKYAALVGLPAAVGAVGGTRSEEHTSELQSLRHLVCRLLLEKKKKKNIYIHSK